MNYIMNLNGIRVSMGMPREEVALKEADFSKPGFFQRAVMPIAKQPGDTIFCSSRCDGRFFDNAVKLVPLDRDLFMPGELRDIQYNTAGYLVFSPAGLRYAIFQVTGDFTPVYEFAKQFRVQGDSCMGASEKTNRGRITRKMGPFTDSIDDYQICSWTVGSYRLISEIASSGSSTFVHFMT